MVRPACHPDPCGVRTSLRFGEWSGFHHEAPYDGSAKLDQSLDSGLIAFNGSGTTLRLAVFDAALPPTSTPERMKEWGRALCRMAGLPISLTEFWQHASTALCDPDRRPRQTNPSFAAAAVDLDLATGSAEIVIGGDCEVWIRQSGVWSSVVSTHMLSPRGYAELMARWEHCVTEAQLWEAQFELVDEPEAWRRAPLGSMPDPVPTDDEIDWSDAALVRRPRYARVKVAALDGIIVSSDGARLEAEHCTRLEDWLDKGLHDVPENHPYPHPHGDLWVAALGR